jgi:hypothetical protein
MECRHTPLDTRRKIQPTFPCLELDIMIFRMVCGSELSWPDRGRRG